MTAVIEVSEAPSKEEMDAIMAPLLKFNADHAAPADLVPLAILIRDKEQRIIGGLWGRTVYQWLFIEHLVVPAELRGQDMGSQLLAQAENIARDRGCAGAWLTTLSFHAQGFYEKMGYEVLGILEHSPDPYNRIILRKYFD